MKSKTLCNVYAKRYMKLLKLISGMVLIIATMLTASGCHSESWQYTFRQDKTSIQKVEICSFEYQDRKEITEPLVSFQGDEADAIINDIAALMCHKRVGLNRNNRFGQIVICIYYPNGEIEVIGTENNGWVESDGDWNLTGTHIYFSELRPLLVKYVDRSVLAGIMSDFR